jgi:hypothetical protein
MIQLPTEVDPSGLLRLDRAVSAVMLPDGRWYHAYDATLPAGPDGYLSFMQHARNQSYANEPEVMIQVAVADVKAVAYFGTPDGGYWA